MLEALNACHVTGIVHRDVKPQVCSRQEVIHGSDVLFGWLLCYLPQYPQTYIASACKLYIISAMHLHLLQIQIGMNLAIVKLSKCDLGSHPPPATVFSFWLAQNVIMSTKDHCAKLIDLGAAADLRVGINYVPSEFLMDPRYSPPQQYIMSTSTPRAPPLPVAAMLSPILWKLNSPDRFDMYSVGILLLQMAFPALRSDNNLVSLCRSYKSLRWHSLVSNIFMVCDLLDS